VLFALLCGGGASLLNIVVHACAIAALVRGVRARISAEFHTGAMVRLVVVMVFAVAILMLAHMVEIWIWGVLYALLGVTPGGYSDFVFAFVNYTTLGYGDVVPEPRWTVLGPMTAMNGVLLFGLSTAVLFQILSFGSRELHLKL
jgi:hypothetical protein